MGRQGRAEKVIFEVELYVRKETPRRTNMQREEQSGPGARGPQSGSDMGVSDVTPPVPSPIPSAEYGRGLG